MKLRNKKTGEIGLVHCDATMFSNKIGVFIDNNHIDLRNPYKIYTSLAELNEEWKDYKESKNPCFINWFGEVSELLGHISNREIKRLKEASNYFESKEEAEKAVERLRAWKRLKDKGFRFSGFSYTELCDYARIDIKATLINDSINDDLNLLFGGEE